MASKSTVKAFCALCIAAILVIAACGCDDLGEYEDVAEYYAAFGDIILVSASSGEDEDYSVEDYFYNEESREEFLAGDDGAYKGAPHADYVYMAIPFESNIDMDTLALFMQSKNDVAVYIYVYVLGDSDEWDDILSGEDNSEQTEGTEGTEGSSGTETGNGSSGTGGTEGSEPQEPVYDVLSTTKKVGEIAVYLESGKWGSFVLDEFDVDGKIQSSIQINDGQYVLLQIRNNCGIVAFDEMMQTLVDPEVGIALDKAEITMTNLLIRALDVTNTDETQGG